MNSNRLLVKFHHKTPPNNKSKDSERGDESVKDNKRPTPTPSSKGNSRNDKSNSTGFMEDSIVMKFIGDVKKGDLEEFDVTTTNGFLKELLVRIKKVDVTGLASQLAFFSFWLYFLY